MKESFWGYLIITIGIIAILVIFFFQNVTNADEQNYTLLKKTTEAAMYDAIDMEAYVNSGIVKINREKFVENFVRRFAQNVKLTSTYQIDIYDVVETPPKVSVRVRSNESTSATGEIIEFSIDNRIDAILETPY